MTIKFARPVDLETMNQMKLACLVISLVIIVNKRLQMLQRDFPEVSCIFFSDVWAYFCVSALTEIEIPDIPFFYKQI